MDTQYIEELRALTDKKEAKAKLVEYAEQNGVQFKKSKGFDGIVEEIKAHFAALADIPMPEQNEGLSISDLIDADDELEGKSAYVEGAEEAKQEAKLLFDAPVKAQVEIKQIEKVIESPIGEVIEPQPVLSENTIEEAVSSIIEDEKPKDILFELPEGFSPHLILMGKGPGYVTLPWWIYEWISKTPDWKENPTSIPHFSAYQTLFSLIYYIKRNGSVRIRETRNSRFIILN